MENVSKTPGRKIALVCIAGEAPTKSRIEGLVEAAGLVVAADAGYAHARSWAIRPDLVIGDLDSISPHDFENLEREGVSISRFDAAKDFTDAELALQYAFSRSYAKVVFTGGGGGRMDHFLALAKLFDKPGCPVRWYTACEEFIFIRKRMEARLPDRSLVSFFRAGSTVPVVRSSGLRWKLDGLEWPDGFSSISNETVGEMLRIEVERGALLMVRSMGEGDEVIPLSEWDEENAWPLKV